MVVVHERFPQRQVRGIHRQVEREDAPPEDSPPGQQTSSDERHGPRDRSWAKHDSQKETTHHPSNRTHVPVTSFPTFLHLMGDSFIALDTQTDRFIPLHLTAVQSTPPFHRCSHGSGSDLLSRRNVLLTPLTLHQIHEHDPLIHDSSLLRKQTRYCPSHKPENLQPE